MDEWNAASRQCFVVSPIGEQGTERFESFRRVLERLIRPVIQESGLGLTVVRADEIHRPGSFIRDVLQYLAQAYLVVVDLTGQNANVFYELGVRHALSPRTILIARSTSDIPADLREYRTLIYADSDHSDETFRQNLLRYLEEIEKGPDTPDNPVLSWLKLPQVPNDLRQTFSARLASVGGTQPEILRFIQQTMGTTGTGVSQSSLEGRFQQKRGEMYYRLEQLRLLGFITKEQQGGEEFTYRLAPAYRRELGLPEISVNLALVSPRGRTLPFGSSTDAPPAHFYYVKATNVRTARIARVRVLVTRIRIFDGDGGLLQDYPTKMQLKWQFATNRCTGKDINASEEAVANVGFIIKDRSFFQLDICADPWPPAFPARLDPRQRMRIDLAPEVAGAAALAGVSLDISWDGIWSDDAKLMEAHLVVSSVASR